MGRKFYRDYSILVFQLMIWIKLLSFIKKLDLR